MELIPHKDIICPECKTVLKRMTLKERMSKVNRVKNLAEFWCPKCNKRYDKKEEKKEEKEEKKYERNVIKNW